MAITSVQGLRSQYYFQPSPVTNGTNSLRVPAHKTDLLSAALTINWNKNSDDAVAIEALEAINSKQQALVKKAGLFNSFIYLNYSNISQNAINTYVKKNVARLWAASKKYDPKGFWQTRVPGYKLPKLN